MPRSRSLHPTQAEIADHLRAVRTATDNALDATTHVKFASAIGRLNDLDSEVRSAASWASARGFISPQPIFTPDGDMQSATALTPTGEAFLRTFDECEAIKAKHERKAA